jgi:spore germination cell wall hydrolase CwlJ-like protein
MTGGASALAEQDTEILTVESEAGADVRALVGGLVLGAAIGAALGGAYWAGDRAQAAAALAQGSPVVASAAPAVSLAQRQPTPVVPIVAASPASLVRSAASVARPFHLTTDSATAPARDVDCLTDAVYYEARGESPAGQAAIAQVVLNRVRHPAYPKSVCGVVYQGARQGSCQFSFACNGALDSEREPEAWRRAKTVAERALAGFVMPVVGDATSFHVATARPDWGANMMRVAQIGLHIFYRFGGHAGAPSRFLAQPEPSAPGSNVTQRQILASTTSQAGSTSADGRPAGQYVLASAVVTATPTSQSAAPTPAASAPAKPATDATVSPSS